jgi:hypothetical protein
MFLEIGIAIIIIIIFHFYSAWSASTTKPRVIGNHQINTYKKMIDDLSHQVKVQQTKLTLAEQAKMESDLDAYLINRLDNLPKAIPPTTL